jgi:hypothetical protein
MPCILPNPVSETDSERGTRKTDRHTEIGTGIQTDRESTQTDKDRITDGQGTEQRWTGKGPQTDRDRDTDRQGKEHRQTGTGTQMKRKRYRDTDG